LTLFNNIDLVARVAPQARGRWAPVLCQTPHLKGFIIIIHIWNSRCQRADGLRLYRTKKNTLCSRDVHVDHVLLFIVLC